MTIAFLFSIWVKSLMQSLGNAKPSSPLKQWIGLTFSWLVLASTATVAKAASNEIAYDCASRAQSITTFSLTDIRKCPPFQKSYLNSTRATIQILQKTTNTLIQAHSCKAVINRQACRWYSYNFLRQGHNNKNTRPHGQSYPN